MMQVFSGFVSVQRDLQSVFPFYYDLGFCPDLVKMNVKPVTSMCPLDFCRPYSCTAHCIRCAAVSRRARLFRVEVESKPGNNITGFSAKVFKEFLINTGSLIIHTRFEMRSE